MVNNPYAFPSDCASGDFAPELGMTLRDWFAGQVLASITHEKFRALKAERGDMTPQAYVSRYCYSQADAMLAERENRND